MAVVVGGARGLGCAIAAAFAAEGATVVLVDRDPEGLRSPGQLEGAGAPRASAFVADVTDFAAIRGVAAEVRRRFGRCDHVVYAAAIGSGKFGFPFWNLDPADWDRVLRVNLVGAVNVAHAFAPAMAEAGAGTLLFLASVAGQIGSQTDPPYSASKAALINFAQCAAKGPGPLGRAGQRPLPGDGADGPEPLGLRGLGRPAAGGRTTPPTRSGRPRRSASSSPLGRWQKPEDIAAMAVFLASPRAENVTGQTINVDGGYVMHW